MATRRRCGNRRVTGCRGHGRKLPAMRPLASTEPDFAEQIARLAGQVAAERFVGVRELFLLAGARPPVILWDPSPANIREPPLLAVFERWRGLRRSGALPLAGDLGRTPRQRSRLRDAGGCRKRCARLHISPLRPVAGPALGRDLTGLRTSSVGGHVSRFSGAVYRAVTCVGCRSFTEHEPPSLVLVRRWSRVLLPLVDERGVVVSLLVGAVPEDPLRSVVDTVIDGVMVGLTKRARSRSPTRQPQRCSGSRHRSWSDFRSPRF